MKKLIIIPFLFLAILGYSQNRHVYKLYIHDAPDLSSPTIALVLDTANNNLVKGTSIVEDPINFLDSFSVGTAYSLTNTPALLDFGTNDPSIIINEAGVYRLYYNVILQYNAATFAANQTITIKIRRTNNGAADIANSTKTTITRIITTVSDHACSISGYVSYSTANNDDILQVWGDVAVVPSAGSLDCVHAQISADRIY